MQPLDTRRRFPLVFPCGEVSLPPPSPLRASCHLIHDSDDDSVSSPIGLRQSPQRGPMSPSSWLSTSLAHLSGQLRRARSWQNLPAPAPLSVHWRWQKPRLRLDWENLEVERTYAGLVTTEEVVDLPSTVSLVGWRCLLPASALCSVANPDSIMRAHTPLHHTHTLPAHTCRHSHPHMRVGSLGCHHYDGRCGHALRNPRRPGRRMVPQITHPPIHRDHMY